MPRRPTHHPTDAELAVLQFLWNTGPATLGQVHQALNAHRPTAKTTVATLLGVMLDKKLVKRADGPRGYVWTARVSRNDAASGIVTKLIDYIFEGSAQRMVAHLVDEGELTDADLEQLWRLRRLSGPDHLSGPSPDSRAKPPETKE
jgi:predicted transcriptional regulator